MTDQEKMVHERERRLPDVALRGDALEDRVADVGHDGWRLDTRLRCERNRKPGRRGKKSGHHDG